MLDLPPPLWLPAKPAVIRPADPEMLHHPTAQQTLQALTMGAKRHRGRRRAAAGGVQTLTFVFSTTSSGTFGVTLPTAGNGAAAGDFALICADNSNGLSSYVATMPPTGWTSFVQGSSATIIGKVLTSGEVGSTITLFDGGETGCRYVTAVFHPDVAITSFAAGEAFGSQETSSNPTAQNINSDTATLPAIAVAQFGSASAIDPRTVSPAMDAELNSNTNHYMQYKIYNVGDTAADHSVDMDDEGANNVLQSGFIEFT